VFDVASGGYFQNRFECLAAPSFEIEELLVFCISLTAAAAEEF
jgi:hypothetical protein